MEDLCEQVGVGFCGEINNKLKHCVTIVTQFVGFRNIYDIY